MGGIFSNANTPPKLTTGEKYVEAKRAKIERDTPADRFATLDIQDQPIRDMGVTKIAEYLEQDSCKIDKMILRRNNATTVGMERLAKSLHLNKSLRELTIIENKMGDQLPKGGKNFVESAMSGGAALVYGAMAAEKLANNLKVNTTLVVLKLEDNLLGNEGCAAIAAALEENKTLTDLTLQRNDISDKGIITLASILASNSSLLRLDLQENVINDEGGNNLFKALATNRTLTEVNLRANSLTAAVCMQLSSMLLANHSLIELNLRRNALKDEGCGVLAKALEKNDSIKRLFLSSNLIGCIGCSRLSESLEKNRVLEEIYLDINNIEDAGCLRFAEALEKNECLNTVDLQMNNFGGPAYKRLAQAIDKNECLRYLKVSSSLMESKEPVKHMTTVLNARVSGEEVGKEVSELPAVEEAQTPVFTAETEDKISDAAATTLVADAV